MIIFNMNNQRQPPAGQRLPLYAAGNAQHQHSSMQNPAHSNSANLPIRFRNMPAYPISSIWFRNGSGMGGGPSNLGMQQAAPAVQQAPPGIQQAPPGIQQALPAMQQAAPAVQQAAPAVQQAPPGVQQGMQQAPPGMQQAPPGMQQAPPAVQQAPPAVQQAPPALQQPAQNPFLPPSLLVRQEAAAARKRKATQVSGADEEPEYEDDCQAIDGNYEMECLVSNCEHVLVKVMQGPAGPATFNLCKSRIMHEAEFFRAALDDKNNFKEKEQAVITLEDEDYSSFYTFITSIFPKSINTDLGLLTPCRNADCNSQCSNVDIQQLVNLFRSVDKYGALSSINIKQRLQRNIKAVINTSICLDTDLYQLIKGFCDFNMDQDAELLKEITHVPDDCTTHSLVHNYRELMTDEAKLNSIKHRVLLPIIAKVSKPLFRKTIDNRFMNY